MTIKLFARTALVLALAAAYGSVLAQTPADSSVTTAAANSIKAWRVDVENPSAAQFVVTFSQALPDKPTSFKGPEGSYVVIDFPKTSIGTEVKPLSSNGLTSLITGSRWAEAGGRTRLVLNVAKGTTHDMRVVGNDLIIALSNPSMPAVPPVVQAQAQVKPVVAPVVAPQASSPVEGVVTALVRDLEYKKVGSANGQLVVDISDPSVKVRVFRDGPNLVLELPNTALPRNLTKRVRVESLETPIQSVNPSATRDGSTRIVLEAKGGWDYTFSQNGGSLAVNVIKISDDYRVGGKKVFTGKKITLSFQQIDVRTVLQILADFTGLNIIASDSVTGSTTLRLNDVPWDQALDLILSSRNLDMRRSGNVITIAPKEEILKKEKQDRDEQLTMEAAEPTVTETFQINYHTAAGIKTLLEAGGASAATGSASTDIKLSPLKLRVDARTNQLFATGTASQLDETRDIIRSVDVPGRQVTIEAKIVEISDSFAKNIGVKMGVDGSIGSNMVLGGALGSSSHGPNSAIPALNVNLPSGASPNGSSPGSFAFTLFNSSLTRFLNLEVQALESDGKAKTVSSPRVVTADNEEAVIRQGTEIPYQQATSSGATSVSFKSATMELKVTPQITPNGKVSLKLSVNKDSVGQVTAGGPSIDTKAVTTKVLVDNGGTIVIGGIFVQDESDVVNKVPLLGDIPLIGNAFKNTGRSTSRKELVIMITPRVIDSAGVLAQ